MCYDSNGPLKDVKEHFSQRKIIWFLPSTSWCIYKIEQILVVKENLKKDKKIEMTLFPIRPPLIKAGFQQQKVYKPRETE